MKITSKRFNREKSRRRERKILNKLFETILKIPNKSKGFTWGTGIKKSHHGEDQI